MTIEQAILSFLIAWKSAPFFIAMIEAADEMKEAYYAG